jgi:hypothetical protein
VGKKARELFFFKLVATFFYNRISQTEVNMQEGEVPKRSWTSLFAKHDIVEQLKDCFTCSNFLFNRDARAHAVAGYLSIMPVKVTKDINMESYRQYMRGALAGKITICDIEFPVDLDPTADITYMHLDQVRNVQDMIKMLGMHAGSMKRLNVNMSLAQDLSRFDILSHELASIMHFFEALQDCTGLEHLTVTQSDYAHAPVKENTVQAILFATIENMNLLELDWSGNMLEQRKHTLDGVTSRWTLCDYLPESLCVLRIRDGHLARMFPWTHKIGLRHGFFWVLCNCNVPSMSSVYMPSGFWSMEIDNFSSYMDAVNHGTFEYIGVSDDFKLNEGPYESTRARSKKRLAAPSRNLEYFITHVSRNMHVDLKGGDDNESEARLAWAVSIPMTHKAFYRREIIDHEGHISCTLCKLDANGKMFKVVILIC